MVCCLYISYAFFFEEMVNFIVNRERLENRLFEMFQERGVDPILKFLTLDKLGVLKSANEDPYIHSIGVTHLGLEIWKHTVNNPNEQEDYERLKKLGMVFDPMIVFLSHLFHDIGKKDVDADVLLRSSTGVGFNHEDWLKMQAHVMFSYGLVKKELPALPRIIKSIIIRHHSYQPEPYPLVFPEEELNIKGYDLEVIDFYAKRLALADAYDSCRTRKNSMYLQRLTSSEAKAVLLLRYPMMEDLIRILYHANVL